MFRVIKSLLNEDKPSPLPYHEVQQDLADKFASFFKDKIDKIRRELPAVDPIYVPLPVPSQRLELFAPTTEDEVRKIIARAPASTCSLDPVPTWLLKDSLDATLPFIVNFINSSLADGVVPQELKQALIKPLLKKPSLDANELKNYRPVSNLPYLSKLLERVVAKRLNDHMKQQGLLYSLHTSLDIPRKRLYFAFIMTSSTTLVSSQ